ncbi:hypothetical protein SLA2020_056640 [Shorea laevis]
MYIALSSFLGLVLCLFWNDINWYYSMHQREGWKPCGNENCFNKTYLIQQASYWRIGSRLAIMETVRNILQKLKINHYNFEQIHNWQYIKKMVHISVYGEQKEIAS